MAKMPDIEIEINVKEACTAVEKMTAALIDSMRDPGPTPNRELVVLRVNGVTQSWCSQDSHRKQLFLRAGDVLTTHPTDKCFTIPKEGGGWWDIQFGRRRDGYARAVRIDGDPMHYDAVYVFEGKEPDGCLPIVLEECINAATAEPQCTCRYAFSGIDRDCPVDHMGRNKPEPELPGGDR